MTTTRFLLALLIASLAYNGWTTYQNDRMKTVVTLIDQKDQLQQQQMIDLTMAVINKTNENVIEVAHQQGKLEGMLVIISGKKPDASESNEIWHAGYYRGLEQAKDMKNSPFTEETTPVTDTRK